MSDFHAISIDQELTAIQTTNTSEIKTLISIGGIYSTKLGALSDETTLRTLLIAKNSGICEGKPAIRGTRILVSNIIELHHLLGWDVQKIRDEYPHLTNEQILAALDYYELHTKEIDSYLQAEHEVDDE